MSNVRPKFSQGDKVFAKVRGYPPWPARVEGSADETPNRMKYHVYFYGTGETAIVKNEDICSFVENKVRLGKPKKPKNFTDALRQIEADLSEAEKQKLAELEANLKDRSPNVSMNDSTGEDAPRKSLSSKPKTSVSPTLMKQKEKKRKLEDSSSEESDKKKALLNSSDSESSAPKAQEVLSRSGRKIKPKRFADYENDSGDESLAIVRPASKPAPRGNSELGSETPSIKLEGEEASNYLIAYVKDEKVKIPLDIERPNSLDIDSEDAWNTCVRSYATSLKKRLENGETLNTSVEEHMAQWGRKQAMNNAMLHTKPTKDASKSAHIQIEGQMLELDLGIRTALNVKNADTAKCIELLNQLNELKLTALMLKKHPDIVLTIKKVRRYIGNVPAAYTQEQELLFHNDTAVIRKKAEHIYNKFQSLFHVPANKSFWDFFEKEKDFFYHQTKDLSTDEIINLVEDIG